MSKIYNCKYCNYSTLRNFDLERHKNNKHKNDMHNNEDQEKEYYCKKCYKSFTSNRCIKSHEEKCNGIDNLTCPKCMKTFTSYQSKHVHIKRNNCKAISYEKYKNPNIHIINNYSNERIDYITIDKFIKILRSNNIIPTYIDYKHFNSDFPENNNILYKNNICYIKSDDKWISKNINTLATLLLRDNSHEIHKRYSESKNIIEDIIKNEDIIEYINKNSNYLDLQIDKIRYKKTIDDIKTIIKAGVVNI